MAYSHRLGAQYQCRLHGMSGRDRPGGLRLQQGVEAIGPGEHTDSAAKITSRRMEAALTGRRVWQAR